MDKVTDSVYNAALITAAVVGGGYALKAATGKDPQPCKTPVRLGVAIASAILTINQLRDMEIIPKDTSAWAKKKKKTET